MGLAVSQARILTLTARKADCQYGISIDSMHKMALTREMTELSQEYYSRLQSKKIAFYHNGQYSKMNYQYLMGYGPDVYPILNRNSSAIKQENSMILTDYKGQVVLSDDYARAITAVLGSSAMDVEGRGGRFSPDKIASMLAILVPGSSRENFQSIIDKKSSNISGSYGAIPENSVTGEDGPPEDVDISEETGNNYQAIVDFYYPIFMAAATNGWTTEYNKAMSTNEDYISDAIVTGSFQLTTVNNAGQYDETATLTYFVTAGLVESRTDSDVREELNAWYNAEKERISEKETMLDLHIDELSTELNTITTEMQSIQSLIDDAVSSVFDWGSG